MTPRCRVLSVQHYASWGGPYNEVVALEKHFNERGWETVVAINDEAVDVAGRLERVVEVHRVPLARFHRTLHPRAHLSTLRALPRDIRGLTALINELRVDLVRVHGPHNPHGAIAARRAGVPVVWVVSSDAVPQGFRRAGARMVRRWADAVLINGRGMVQAYPALGAVAERTFTYYSPVDLDRFQPVSQKSRAQARAALGLRQDSVVVGTLANINPQKDVELFVAAADELARRNPSVQFVVIGGHSPRHQALYDRMVERAHKAGLLPDRLVLAGARPDVERLLPSFDVMVLTSRWEGTSTTIPEAFALEIPVVATDVGSVGELVISGRTGVLVNERRPESLCRAVESLLRAEGRGRDLGKEGRRLVVRTCSVQECARRQLQAYHFAIGRGLRHST